MLEGPEQWCQPSWRSRGGCCVLFSGSLESGRKRRPWESEGLLVIIALSTVSLAFCVDKGKPGEITLENMTQSNGGIQESVMVCQLRDFEIKTIDL